MSDRLYFPVPDECDNMLAQRFLRDKCGLSARIITRLKREKDGILIDGKILRTIDCVQSGKTVSIAIPDEKCKIEPTKGKLDIRYEADILIPYIQRFDYLGIREKTGKELLEEYMNRNIDTVLDPTLLLDQDDWSIVATHRLVKEPYALVYFFSNSYKVRRMLEKFCEKRGLKLVLIPYAKQEFNLGDHRGKCVRLDNVGPSEFVSAIKYADYVFTDSFHGAVFSIIHGKQFYVFERNKKGHVSMNSRLYDLLDTFHLRNRLLAMDSSVEDIDDIDYKQVDSILTKEKEKSTNFLKKALEG